MKKIFLNLTNGIEALEKYDININDVNFIRLQSTHCEQFQFERILMEIDNNFLMWLALGYECEVYDFGAESETSKAVYHGLEWLRYVLNLRWFSTEITPIVRTKNVLASFRKYYANLDKKAKKRIDYFKKFLQTDTIKLSAVTDETTNDGKPEYYVQIINNILSQKF